MKCFKKEDLERKYLHLPLIRKSEQKGKSIFEMIKRIDKKSILEEVATVDYILDEKKKELHDIKIHVIRELILNNKPIPERWILKSDYESLLDEAMSDPIVLQYAVVNSDMYRKRAYPEFEYKKPKIALRKLIINPTTFTPKQQRTRITYNSPLLYTRRGASKYSTSKSTLNVSRNEKVNRSTTINNNNRSNDEGFMLTCIEENKELTLPKIDQLFS